MRSCSFCNVNVNGYAQGLDRFLLVFFSFAIPAGDGRSFYSMDVSYFCLPGHGFIYGFIARPYIHVEVFCGGYY